VKWKNWIWHLFKATKPTTKISLSWFKFDLSLLLFLVLQIVK